jgi:hypothetical protein
MWSLIRRQTRQTKSFRRTPFSACPRLEALEDRFLLSASLVWDYGGGQSPQSARGVATDRSGNEYVAGSFSGTAVLTGANGSSATLTAPPVPGTQTAQTDVYLAKYDPSGTLLWARSMGTSWSDDAYGIAVDGACNAYLTGELAPGSLTFGSSTYSNTTGYETAYVAKYDPLGNALWLQTANSIGGTTFGGGITVGADGSVYATGRFYGTATFGNTTLNSPGDTGMFAEKLSAAGQVIWARGVAGTGGGGGTSLAVDGAGNVLVGGDFFGKVDFDPGPQVVTLNSGGSSTSAGFVLKLDNGGSFVWAKSFLVSRGQGPLVEGIAVDTAGNVYAAGTFYGTVDFDPGRGKFNLTAPNSDSDGFVVKLDASGSFAWAQQLGGAYQDTAAGIALDSMGNVYVVGTYDTTVYPNRYQTAVWALDANGHALWTDLLGGGDNWNNAVAIAVGPDNSLTVVGSFQGTADFDPGPGQALLSTTQPHSMFLVKLR